MGHDDIDGAGRNDGNGRWSRPRVTYDVQHDDIIDSRQVVNFLHPATKSYLPLNYFKVQERVS
jgi:hypothetical protein